MDVNVHLEDCHDCQYSFRFSSNEPIGNELCFRWGVWHLSGHIKSLWFGVFVTFLEAKGFLLDLLTTLTIMVSFYQCQPLRATV